MFPCALIVTNNLSFWIYNKLFKADLKGLHSYKTSVFSKSKILRIPLLKPHAKNNSWGAATHIGGSLLETNWKASALCSISHILTELSPSIENK